MLIAIRSRFQRREELSVTLLSYVADVDQKAESKQILVKGYGTP